MTVQSRQAYGAYPSYVRVTDPPFNARGDGVTDDTAAIQAAIDHAIANNINIIVLPPDASAIGSVFRITAPLYLDHPGNLRVSLTAPPAAGYGRELTLSGGDGVAYANYGHARIVADFDDDVALWVGPGRGMTVRGIALSGPPSGPRGSRLGLPATSIGIAVAAYASGTLIENCTLNLFHYGIVTGANNLPQLTDATTIRKCNITAAVGVQFREVNNFINSVEDCVISAVVGIEASNSTGCQVRGGNISANMSGNLFPLSSVSASVFQGPPYTNWGLSLTGIVNNPDDNITWSAYNAFAIVTPHFGIVPFTLTSYNQATGEIVLAILDSYIGFLIASYADDPSVATNLIPELVAAGVLYACERAVTLRGGFITAEHIHIETYSPTCLFEGDPNATAGENTQPNALREIRINESLTGENYGPAVIAGTATAQQAAFYYISRSFPQLSVGLAPLEVVNLAWLDTTERWIIDCINPQAPNLHVRGPFPRAQFRIPIYAAPLTNQYNSAGTCGIGLGEFEDNPFYGRVAGSLADYWRAPLGVGKAPMLGYRPQPWATPNITPAQLQTLQGSLPPIDFVNALCPYPILWGGQVYRLADYNAIAAPYHFTSNHAFYSYGQALPISWTYLGQSCHLYVSDTRLLFPGLGILLDNGDGSGPLPYIITGVYPQLGFVTVLTGVESGQGPWRLAGLPTTGYAGSVIGQQPYSLATGGVAIGTTAPATPLRGDAWYDSTLLRVFDGTSWQRADGSIFAMGGGDPWGPPANADVLLVTEVSQVQMPAPAPDGRVMRVISGMQPGGEISFTTSTSGNSPFMLSGPNGWVNAGPDFWTGLSSIMPITELLFVAGDSVWWVINQGAPAIASNFPGAPVSLIGKTDQANPATIYYSTPGSYTWTCQRTGRYQIMAAGPGGGGASWIGGAGSSARYSTGASGGVAQGILRITQGQTLQINVPPGGGAAGGANPNAAVFGTNSGSTTIIWPYVGANDGTGPIPGWGARHWHMWAQFGPDGGIGSAITGGYGDAPNITGNPGLSGDATYLWLTTSGRQITGTSSAGPVQITSGHGGNALSPGGAGSALVAWVGP